MVYLLNPLTMALADIPLIATVNICGELAKLGELRYGNPSSMIGSLSPQNK
jgi:hypothetical protein